MFAVIAPALMTGAFADRMMFTPYLISSPAGVHLVYFPFCHSVWGGGFLAEWGVWDFAGGIVVHISAGFSALAAVMAMPHRKKIEAELDTDPHNIPFVALGTAMLWFGWFGFNAGSALNASTLAAYGAINTEISASCALFSWMIVEWLHKGKPTLVGACVGAIAGLATITPAAGFVRPWAAMIIGLLSAPWCYGLVELVKDKLVIDDALDVFAVHGMGGFLGTLCIGIFADENVGGVKASGELFGKLRRRRRHRRVRVRRRLCAREGDREVHEDHPSPARPRARPRRLHPRRARVQGHLPERRQDCRLIRTSPDA